MNLTLKVSRAQHGSSDLLDTGDLDEPDDRIAQIGQKPERVVAQHDACRDNPAGEM